MTNIVLDALFVFGFHWGLAGAAGNRHFAATDVSCLFSHFLFSRKTHFHFTRFTLDLSQYQRIVPIGIADCITGIIGGVIVFAFNHQILSIIGTSGVVSYTVMTYVYNLVLMAFVGIAQGCQPLVSYAVGQQDSKTIKLVYRYGLTAVARLRCCASAAVGFYAADRFGLHPV